MSNAFLTGPLVGDALLTGPLVGDALLGDPFQASVGLDVD
jgi:hypothetical protein